MDNISLPLLEIPKRNNSDIKIPKLPPERQFDGLLWQDSLDVFLVRPKLMTSQ